MIYYKKVRGARNVDHESIEESWSFVDFVYTGISDEEWLPERTLINSIICYARDFLDKDISGKTVRECLAVLEESGAILSCDIDRMVENLNIVRDVIRNDVPTSIIMASEGLMKLAEYRSSDG